ncbi:MAG: diguanylate cyclase, partial [Chloroflexi bacterium]|nr:diguanylate cyclase [Chloroflexota bacterium]
MQLSNEQLLNKGNELEQRTREITLLNEMGEQLQASITVEDSYGVIAKAVEALFPGQAGALYIVQDDTGMLASEAVWGDASAEAAPFAPEDCAALHRSRPSRAGTDDDCLACAHAGDRAPGDSLCVPMMTQGGPLGVLHLHRGPTAAERLTSAQQRLAVTVAEHAALALANLRLRETLREQAIRDPLTGLFNRRFMQESLDREVSRSARNHRPLGIIMLDIDRFKLFNDTHGHDAGDAVLRELGRYLMENVRGEDIACRYGGEELMLILPDATLEA